MNAIVANEQLWWYVARSSGIVSLVLTGLAVIWGLALSTKVLAGRPPASWLLSLHRFLGALSVVFVGVHVAGLMLDSYIHFGPAEILVPFVSDWRPGAVAWGIVSMYLLIAVETTSLLMKRIPRRWWRRVHQSSFLLFWTAVVHGITAGTDASNPLYIATTVSMTVAVIFLTIYRSVMSRRSRRQPLPQRSTPSVVG